LDEGIRGAFPQDSQSSHRILIAYSALVLP
jgi:hypothetical protein